MILYSDYSVISTLVYGLSAHIMAIYVLFNIIQPGQKQDKEALEWQ